MSMAQISQTTTYKAEIHALHRDASRPIVESEPEVLLNTTGPYGSPSWILRYLAVIHQEAVVNLLLCRQLLQYFAENAIKLVFSAEHSFCVSHT